MGSWCTVLRKGCSQSGGVGGLEETAGAGVGAFEGAQQGARWRRSLQGKGWAGIQANISRMRKAFSTWSKQEKGPRILSMGLLTPSLLQGQAPCSGQSASSTLEGGAHVVARSARMTQRLPPLDSVLGGFSWAWVSLRF